MRIAVLAHLRHPIRAPFMGGMEAHAHVLTRALIARGHDVTLFAAGDSDPALPLHPILPRHYEATLPWAQWHGTAALTALQTGAFDAACAAIGAQGFDVIHNNAMHPTPHDWARATGQAMVTSLHVPPFAGLADAVARSAAPWLRQTATSHAHLAGWWAEPPATASVVHNGVDPAAWRFVASGNGRAVWCGRVTPNKGTHVAIDAARAAGLALDLVGPIDCMDYFEGEVRPRLHGDCRYHGALSGEVRPRLDGDCRYHGALSGEALVSMMGAASVLLATPMWDEPFGLVVAEAMACGVPVAALDRGAMREVIGDGADAGGALAATPADLPAAIERALAVPRPACRARVATHFCVDAMIDGYEAAYAAAVAASRSRSASTVALLA